MFCCSCTEDSAASESVVLATEDEGNPQSGGSAPYADPEADDQDNPDRGKLAEPVSILDKADMSPIPPVPSAAGLLADAGPDELLHPSESWRARGPKVREWKIQIEKKGSLGIDIGKDKTSLLIGRVNDGPVKDWNNVEGRDSSEMCARGDRILEVNGQRGDVQEILQALSSARNLEISLSRLMEFRITNLPREGPLGIEFDSSITEYLVIKEIGEGSAQIVNRKLRPDYELRPQDMILEVNGEVGEASLLEAALDKTNLLTLLVRRPT